MNITDKFLHFIFSHQLVLIEALFALILGLCVVWLFAHLQKGADSTEEDKKFKDLERTLERVLEKAQAANLTASAAATSAPASTAKPGGVGTTVPPTPSTTPSGATASAVAPIGGVTAALTPAAAVLSAEQLAELGKLKTENETKAQKLSELEKALALAKESLEKAQSAQTSAAPAVDVSEFQKRIRELESRLGEYEIIEDDIANLSLYKEENIRLKNDLQKLKTGMPQVSAEKVETGEAASKVSEPTKPLTEEIVEEIDSSVKAIDSDKLLQEAGELAANPVEASAAVDDGKDPGQKLIEEFEGFMKGAGR